MKDGFVQTQNYRKFVAAVAAIAKRAAPEAGYLLLTGAPGLGKSEAVAKYSLDHNAVLIRAKSTSTKRGLVDELANSMCLPTHGRTMDVQNRIIAALVGNISKDNPVRPIVVDEADHTISRNAASLEVIRDITDMTMSVCIIVGMENIETDLARYPQIASRINTTVEFMPLTEADIRAVCKQKTDVIVSDDAIKIIARAVGGKMRLLLNAIAKIEQIAKSNSISTITANELKDVDLCFEWQSRSARKGASRAAIMGSHAGQPQLTSLSGS